MNVGGTVAMRWLRSLILAVLTALSAGLAHVGGGGHRAPVWLLLALVGMGAPVLFALSERRWRFGPLVAVMGVTQVALHAVMSMGAHTGGHAIAGGHLAHEPGALAHVAHAAHAAHAAPSATMAFAHIGMTLFLAACVAWGERALSWGICLLFRGVPTDPALSPRLRAPRVRLVAALHPVWFVRSSGCRAPPSAFALALS